MSTALEKLLEFCVEYELLDTESAAEIACYYDRHWESLIGIVVKSGVDEGQLFEVAASIHHLQLVTFDQLTVDKDAVNIIPLNHSRQLSCIPYAVNSSELSVVTSDWNRLEVVTKGMENLTGKKIRVSLITESDYTSLYESLVDQ